MYSHNVTITRGLPILSRKTQPGQALLTGGKDSFLRYHQIAIPILDISGLVPLRQLETLAEQSDVSVSYYLTIASHHLEQTSMQSTISRSATRW